MSVEIHGVEDAEEVGRQIKAGEVGSALFKGRIGHDMGAVEVEEQHLPRGVGIVRIAAEADVLVAQVAVQDPGVVHRAHGGGGALEQRHQRGAVGALGIHPV